MRLITIIILLLSGILNAFGEYHNLLGDTTKHGVKKHYSKQLAHSPKPKNALPPDKLYYNDCVFIHKYSVAERLKKYPFLKAAQILAVSYDGSPEPNPDIQLGDDTPKTSKKRPHGLFVKNGTLDYSSLFEVRKLTPNQINRLTNLMFNTDTKVHYDHNKYADPGFTCFEPRNALIFFDNKGKVFDYIEICFECERTESNSNKLILGIGCNQELDFAKKFFIDLGIKFGTTSKDDSGFN